MERLVQILDDLDDLIGVIGLAKERILSLLTAAAFAIASVCIQIGGVVLALSHPPLALAAALLMFVALLYRSVTSPLEIA